MEAQWLTIGASLLGGGAVGALITAFAHTRRSRIQPVNYQLEVNELFSGTSASAAANIMVTITDEGQQFVYHELQEVSLIITNRGNTDLRAFQFNVDLPSGCKAILVDASDMDRSHRFTEKPVVSPSAPISSLDFEVAPFNRGDAYEMTAYLTGARDLGRDDLRLSSAAPIYFKQTPTALEMVANTMSRITIRVGDIELGLQPFSSRTR